MSNLNSFDMATTTSTVFNIYTNGHGSHDRSWNDYIDYSDDRGIVFDSLDYDLPTHSRSQITECKYMDAEQTEKARKAVIAKLVESVAAVTLISECRAKSSAVRNIVETLRSSLLCQRETTIIAKSIKL
mgnify:CR=1 FL=1